MGEQRLLDEKNSTIIPYLYEPLVKISFPQLHQTVKFCSFKILHYNGMGTTYP